MHHNLDKDQILIRFQGTGWHDRVASWGIPGTEELQSSVTSFQQVFTECAVSLLTEWGRAGAPGMSPRGSPGDPSRGRSTIMSPGDRKS